MWMTKHYYFYINDDFASVIRYEIQLPIFAYNVEHT